jgi:hypothetical protein
LYNPYDNTQPIIEYTTTAAIILLFSFANSKC